MIDDDQLSERLAHAGRALGGGPTPEVDTIFSEMLGAVRSTRKRRGKHAGLWSVIAVGGAIAIGVTTLPAAADAVHDFFAYRMNGGDTASAPGQRWVDTGAADITELIRSKFPEDLPLPTGVTRSDVESVVIYAHTRVHVYEQESAIDASYVDYVYCRWLDVWIVSNVQENTAARDTATRVLREATHWPVGTANSGGAERKSQREKAAASAEDGGGGGVQVAFNGCGHWQTIGTGK